MIEMWIEMWIEKWIVKRRLYASTFLALAACSACASAQQLGFWEARPKLRFARQEVAVAELGGKAYVAGGLAPNRSGSAVVEVYDPSTRLWSRVADMPIALHHHGLAAVGGKLYQLGGYPGRGFSPTAQCHVWDPATNRWTRIPDMPRARAAFVAVALGTKIYCAAGIEQAEGVSNTIVIYDTVAKRWSSGARMRFRREHVAAAALAGRVHVIGGRAGANNAFHESYDPASDRWTTLAPMPTPRGGNSAAAIDGKLLVFGGEAFGPSRVFKETEEYDPTTNTWRALRDMRVPVHGIQAVLLGDEIFVPGGGVVAGYSTTDEVSSFRYDPTGALRFGSSTASCRGSVRLCVLSPLVVPAPSFGFETGARVPANSLGIVALGAKEAGGRRVAGIDLYVALAPQPLLLVAPTDASGSFRMPLPAPASLRGFRVSAQAVFPSTAACGNGKPLAASDALELSFR